MFKNFIKKYIKRVNRNFEFILLYKHIIENI